MIEPDERYEFMRKHTRWLSLVIAAMLLAACGRSALTPAAGSVTRTPIPVFTATPVGTPAPTATSTSTSTPEPTATVEPTATFTPEPTATAIPPTEIPATDVPTATPEIVPPPLAIDPQIGQHPYSMTLQTVSTGGVTQSFTMGFLLYLPRAYGQDPAQTWPLILFLHGSSENGADPAMVAATGLPELLIGDADYPFIVVSPQAPEDVVWWGAELDRVAALLDYVQANFAVNPRREYLTGLSMGGFGAWAMTIRYPDRFAAVAPIAGGWNSENDSIPRNICALKDMPIWVFHGEQDDIVLPKKSQLMVDALKKCGSDVKFTLYPATDHRASWALAYDDSALFEWLLAQQLP
ncbi:MAG: prolyl oligopeptidase family serine peptidase [Chloroflexi bacterium]|nr:prolyl oligopeptidase family serine peptidase [Chloroflexota bacterium]